MLKDKRRIILVAVLTVTVSSALGYVAVRAAHPFVHPTWPEVKAKYWSHAERNGRATALFFGKCVQPNPTRIQSQFSMMSLHRRCKTVDTVVTATVWLRQKTPQEKRSH